MLIVGAIILGAFLGSFADWLFAGVLFHDRYQTYPEVWRKGNERQRITLAQLTILISSAGFVLLATSIGQTGWIGTAKLAFLLWIIGPLPLLLGNHLFIRLDPLVTLSHSIGWLIKFLLIAGATAAIL